MSNAHIDNHTVIVKCRTALKALFNLSKV